MQTAERINPERLYQARLAADLSQADLAFAIRDRADANRFSPTERSIRRWEKGTNVPHADIVPAIADALGVSIQSLYGSDGENDDDEEVD